MVIMDKSAKLATYLEAGDVTRKDRSGRATSRSTCATLSKAPCD